MDDEMAAKQRKPVATYIGDTDDEEQEADVVMADSKQKSPAVKEDKNKAAAVIPSPKSPSRLDAAETATTDGEEDQPEEQDRKRQRTPVEHDQDEQLSAVVTETDEEEDDPEDAVDISQREERRVANGNMATTTTTTAKSKFAMTNIGGKQTQQTASGKDGDHRQKEPASSKAATTSTSANVIVNELPDVDERMWGFFQEARSIIGVDEALEVLGYLKLEYLIGNEFRTSLDQICPPSFILGNMNKPNMPPLLTRVRQYLDLNSLKIFTNPAGMRRAFAELEKSRPGTIFGLLGHFQSDSSSSTFRGAWLFPSKVSSPIFGAVLGVDGFRTFKMTYRKQTMFVPIAPERDGSVTDAAIQGFSRLVSPSFGFSLIRTGDCQFEVAASPDEECDQIFVKTVNGRIISLSVPVDKARIGFVKVLVCAYEGYLPHQQRFIISDNKQHVGGADTAANAEEDNDNVLLTDCQIKPFSTMHLVLRVAENSH
jgi:hypothetical protein